MILEERQHRTEKPSEDLKVFTGFRNVITIQRRAVRVLEIEDLLFHHDSAVMMPDALGGSVEQDRITGLDVVTTAYHHARDHPDQKLLIAGHTDASGPDAYNEKLSRLRAENVLYVLLGERDPWVDSAKNKGKVEDYQQILTWIAAWQGWPCDSQGIDGDHGSNTDAAVRAFQERYSEADFGEEISVDGDVGRQTWGAFFRLYQLRLEELTETDESGLADLRGKLGWLYDDLKVTGCGEYHPVGDVYVPDRRSQTNRRIELLFYEPGEEPPSKPGEICHEGGLDGAEDCPIYNDELYDYRNIDVGPSPTDTERVLIDDPLLGLLTGLSVSVHYQDGSTEPLTTDADGVIEVARDRGTHVKLEWETELARYDEIAFIVLDPVATASGAWQRLVNLGYLREPEPTEPEDLERALAEFQAEHGLEPTAELDDETRQALEESVDSATMWSERDLGDDDWLDREARDYPLDSLT